MGKQTPKLSEQFTVYITKYTLSTGKIEKAVATRSITELDDYVQLQGQNRYISLYRLGKDAFLTRDEALANAHEKRLKKIRALEKQIAKLRQANFA